jgi:uncharacterized protein YggE
MRSLSRLLPLAALCLLVALLAACRSAPEPPTVIVGEGGKAMAAPRVVSGSGTAEIETTPDEFVITVGFENFATEVAKAKADNDAVMRAVVDVPGHLGVAPRWVRTEAAQLTPQYEGNYYMRRITGFVATKTMVVTLQDDAQVEPLLAALFTAGANRLEGVTARSTKVLEQRREARSRAVAAARDKAEAMASLLGQKLGHPLKMDEAVDGGMWSARPVANTMVNNETTSAVRDAMAAGKIHVAASVNVTFELHDG